MRTVHSHFSLVELIAVLTIVGLLTAGASVATVSLLEGFSRASDYADAAQKAQLALSRLVKEFAFITDTPVIANGGRSVTYTSAYPGITAAARSVSWSGTVGDPLLLGADTLVDGVQSFAVSSPDPGAINISLTLSSTGSLTYATTVCYDD